MSLPSTIIFAGGGTGGHLYPGIAVADALRTLAPETEVVFFCTEREIDAVILKPTGYTFVPQPIVPPNTTVGGLLRFWKGWRETKDLVRTELKKRNPTAVLGLGGYAAGVAVKMAASRKIPSAILNPDVIPGKANRFLMRYTQAVCCQFKQTAKYLGSEEQSKLKTTGCPIRQDILKGSDRAEAMQRLELNPQLKTLLVTGASLGAQTVNEAVLRLFQEMSLDGWQVLHLAGRDHANNVRAGYRSLKVNVRVIDFTPAMADVWSVADLCISRSGASSCAELTACGIPSVLMPYPYHKDLHQKANAQVLTDAGAAEMIDDEKEPKKNAAKLKPILDRLLYDANQRATMVTAAKTLGCPDAAQSVATVLLDLAKNYTPITNH